MAVIHAEGIAAVSKLEVQMNQLASGLVSVAAANANYLTLLNNLDNNKAGTLSLISVRDDSLSGSILGTAPSSLKNVE
jgi:hypothetical protein